MVESLPDASQPGSASLSPAASGSLPGLAQLQLARAVSGQLQQLARALSGQLERAGSVGFAPIDTAASSSPASCPGTPTASFRINVCQLGRAASGDFSVSPCLSTTVLGCC